MGRGDEDAAERRRGPRGAARDAEPDRTRARTSRPTWASCSRSCGRSRSSTTVESFEASLIRVARRDYEKAVRVPPSLRAELTRAGSLGYQAWLRAREQEDYGIMLPHLERNLELRRQYVACFEPADDPYDVVLDDYEPGMKTVGGRGDLRRAQGGAAPDGFARSAISEPIDDSCLPVASRARRSGASRCRARAVGDGPRSVAARQDGASRSRRRSRPPTSG